MNTSLSQNTQQMTLEQAVGTLRNNIVIGHSKSEGISLDSFDKIVGLLQQQGAGIIQKDKEIKRLQELCKENKIDYTPIVNAPEVKPIQVIDSK